MSELEELVVVDTTEELSDPANEVSADQSVANQSESTITFVLESEQDDTDEDNVIIRSNENSNATGKGSGGKPAKNRLTYEKNPFGILLQSKFKVRAEMEDVPGSSEKKCHFSVEGNEINIKFPLRGDNPIVMKRMGARKVIDFIMSLDRVPARLAELMTVPKEDVAQRVVKPAKSSTPNYRIVQQGDNRHVLMKRRNEPKQCYNKFRCLCAELSQANLMPKIELVTRRDLKSGIMAKVATRLPGLDIKFVSTQSTNMLAKLTSVTKALNYARSHSLGSFGATNASPLTENTFQSQEPSHAYYQQPPMHHYSTDTNYWSDPPQNHISVHSRLAPRVSPPPVTPHFDDSPLLSFPARSATNIFQAPATYFDTTPPEDFSCYPQSSTLSQFPTYTSLRYMRGYRAAPYDRDWKGPARARLRTRRGKVSSRRGKQPNNSF